MTDELALAKALETGKLELLCPEMHLLSCPSCHDSLLEGTGVIQSGARGRLSFNMVATPNAIPDLARRENRPHGEVYEAEDHVMLLAVDQNGREWRSNWLLPRLVHPGTGSPCWMVGHALESLSHATSRPHIDQSEGRLYFPRQLHLPFDKSTHTTKTVGNKQIEFRSSTDHHVRRIGQAEVEFRSLDVDWLVVRGKQSTPIMPDWAGVVCQALSFATAHTTRPILVARDFNDRKDLQLFSGPPVEFQTHLTPPLIPRSSKTADEFWAMIQNFVEWASDGGTGTRSKVFDELAGIRSGATASIQTACLTLALGIESIADLMLGDEPVAQDQEQAKQIANLFEHFRAWSGDKPIRDRACSVLGSMSTVRAVDRLYAFARRTGTPEPLISAWKKLRDMKAHGRAPGDDQQLYDLYYSATELLYRIICSTIGYTGEITETSQRGWGMDEWGFPNERKT